MASNNFSPDNYTHSKPDGTDNNNQQENPSKHQYLLKNDENEIARLSKQHEMFKLVWRGLYYSPVQEDLEKGIIVLDSGCGPGAWTIDMSQKYPNSSFYGIDISTMFSVHENTKPANCYFDVANVLQQPLSYPENHFDFVHQRLLGVAIPQQCWQSVVDGFMRVLKPGGWIELTETSDVLNMSPKGSRLRSCLYNSAADKGIRMSATRELELYMLNAGFTNIKVVPMLFPCGKSDTGDNTVGDMFQDDFLRLYKRGAIQALAMKKLPEINSPEDYDTFLHEVLEEYNQNNTSMLAFRFYGQKPLSQE